MMEAQQTNLDRSYNLFINQDQALPFFKGLNGYIEYALSTSPFHEVFAEQIQQYEAGNKKIEQLERKTLKEAVAVRDNLEAIVKKKRIDVHTLRRFQTMEFNDETTLFEEFDSFHQGRSIGSGFRSDSLQKYLFDIAANLLILGYK